MRFQFLRSRQLATSPWNHAHVMIHFLPWFQPNENPLINFSCLFKKKWVSVSKWSLDLTKVRTERFGLISHSDSRNAYIPKAPKSNGLRTCSPYDLIGSCVKKGSSLLSFFHEVCDPKEEFQRKTTLYAILESAPSLNDKKWGSWSEGQCMNGENTPSWIRNLYREVLHYKNTSTAAHVASNHLINEFNSSHSTSRLRWT